MRILNDESSRDDIIKFLKQKKLSEDKIAHSIAVTDLALKIAEEISNKGLRIDKHVVEAGALLHDIGLAVFGEKTFETEMARPTPEHCALGGKIALESGFSERVAHCIESHELWAGGEAKAVGFPAPVKEDYIPKTWEAKAVAYADTVVSVAVEEGRDLWNDPGAVAKTYHPYFDKCFRNTTGKGISKDHPLLRRIVKFHEDMVGFLRKKDIPEPWREFARQTE